MQGNLVFTAASEYMVEVSPANADRVNVSGTATLGGASVNASFAAGTYVAKQYTIVNATGGVSGTFGTQVNTNLPSGFHSSLSYDANDAYLNLALNFVPPPSGGLSGNQQNVANAIVGFFNSNGGIPIVFGGLTPAGLTQIFRRDRDGIAADNLRRDESLYRIAYRSVCCGPRRCLSAGNGRDRVRGGKRRFECLRVRRPQAHRRRARRPGHDYESRAAQSGVRPALERVGGGFGGSQTTDGNAALGSNNTTSRVAGGVVGADYRFSPFTLAGFARRRRHQFLDRQWIGIGRSDLFQAAPSFGTRPARLTSLPRWPMAGRMSRRTAPSPSQASIGYVRSSTPMHSGRVESGYRFVTPWMGITPYAAGQFTTFSLPAYAEQVLSGANTFALTYGAKDVTASRSELGLRSDRSFAMQDGIFTLRGRAAWAHNFNTDRSISATFQTLPGASFVVNGAMQSHDAALATASAEMKWLNGFSLAATFEGEFSDVTKSYAGKGVARYSW